MFDCDESVEKRRKSGAEKFLRPEEWMPRNNRKGKHSIPKNKTAGTTVKIFILINILCYFAPFSIHFLNIFTNVDVIVSFASFALLLLLPQCWAHKPFFLPLSFFVIIIVVVVFRINLLDGTQHYDARSICFMRIGKKNRNDVKNWTEFQWHMKKRERKKTKKEEQK